MGHVLVGPEINSVDMYIDGSQRQKEVPVTENLFSSSAQSLLTLSAHHSHHFPSRSYPVPWPGQWHWIHLTHPHGLLFICKDDLEIANQILHRHEKAKRKGWLCDSPGCPLTPPPPLHSLCKKGLWFPFLLLRTLSTSAPVSFVLLLTFMFLTDSTLPLQPCPSLLITGSISVAPEIRCCGSAVCICTSNLVVCKFIQQILNMYMQDTVSFTFRTEAFETSIIQIGCRIC